MVDECTVERLGDGAFTNAANGVVDTFPTEIYSGKCKMQQTMSQSSTPVSGGHQFTVQDTRWDTPVSAGPFQIDDVVTVTAAVLDPQLVGRQYRVVELFHKSAATAQRTRVEEVPA